MRDHVDDEHTHIDDEELLLTLQLSTGPPNSARHAQQPPLTSQFLVPPPFAASPARAAFNSVVPSRSSRARRSPAQAQTLAQGKSETIPAPFLWATTTRARVHSLQYLLSNGMSRIRGAVQCKKCDQSYEIEYDLQGKFVEVASYVSQHKNAMHDRAPSVWMTPTLPDCKFCGQSNCVKPEILKKRSINWLFLLLGQLLGMCKLSELKYFCKHTRNHRTGAKDRVLYLTYLGLLKQLEPSGPFDV